MTGEHDVLIKELQVKIEEMKEECKYLDKKIDEKEERIRRLEYKAVSIEERVFSLSNLLEEKVDSLRDSFEKSIEPLSDAVKELKMFRSKLNWMVIGTLASSAFTLLTIIIGLIITLSKLGS
jgi:chromosome segregation ATPase